MTTIANKPSISIPWGKVAGITVAALMANIFNSAIQKDIYGDPFYVSDNSQTYSLTSPNKVLITDGSGLNHTVDFRNTVVSTGAIKSVKWGGAGYGGNTNFEDFNQKSLADAKKAGCDIADIIENHKTSIAYKLSFTSPFAKHQHSGKVFKAQFCPTN